LKSWTRTLNLDDAHTLLALAVPGTPLAEWTAACHDALPDLSAARRRELVRILRDSFLEHNGEVLGTGLFMQFYANAPAVAQIDLVKLQWALTHDLSLLAAERLVAPALSSGHLEIPLARVETFVAEHLDTRSQESLRKTRTVLLGALDGIGVLHTRGTGQHRSLSASRATPHPLAFAYLVARDLKARGDHAMMAAEVAQSSLPVRLTQCEPQHARDSLKWCLDHGLLGWRGDEIALGQLPA